ncbi:hypothetical protein GCM10023093_25860 [Nemorincola caseinilytica]|uniref:Uncharacterized protein n=1 Tax=Nemorincola caseinilytica TaxID=2054315 RepID=A0ABP8NMN0_9BACT
MGTDKPGNSSGISTDNGRVTAKDETSDANVKTSKITLNQASTFLFAILEKNKYPKEMMKHPTNDAKAIDFSFIITEKSTDNEEQYITL